ncbi:hypothetical protein F4553_006413 [Allocatelliglobosispora scoriae]|uniref:Fibronectin type-III domain-containing protein n=1 Tax=Allocatelliglobosispora scoriae TaxID=643052 RepID=A0A841C0W2_9ACTN|nr:fibronectin type III domain-containing protein [Allocatelliglobosispora scoriae]MBB5872979.1 hypothetical protein [Allocatelliglobosispora scoriae]
MSAAQHAREQIVSLGILLDDMAGGRSGDEVHQLLLDRFDQPEHDSRLDRMEVGRHEFTQTWAALRGGTALPQSAWEQVILPAVVALSGPKTHKINLELATNHWLTARSAVDAVPGHPDEVAEALARIPFVEQVPVSGPPAPWPAAVPLRAATIIENAPSADDPRRSRRGLVWALGALIVVALVAVGTMFLLQGEPDRRDGPPMAAAVTTPAPGITAVVVVPSIGPSPLPTSMPSSAPQPSPAITTLPTPSPVWTGSGQSKPPTAPLNLTAVAATQDTVVLTWSPPLDGGTGGVAYYRILRDGSPSGWTRQTSVTIVNLNSGTGYTFTVIACNDAGLLSPPSNSVTVVTATPPSAPSPTPSPTDPVTEAPSPTDAPSPTPDEPSSEAPAPTDPPVEPETATAS